MYGKVITHAMQNPGVDKGKYSMPLTQLANGLINRNFDQVTVMSQRDIDEHIVGLIMVNQYLLKKVLELFGDKGKVTAIKELWLIHDMDTYTPMSPKKLS